MMWLWLVMGEDFVFLRSADVCFRCFLAGTFPPLNLLSCHKFLTSRFIHCLDKYRDSVITPCPVTSFEYFQIFCGLCNQH